MQYSTSAVARPSLLALALTSSALLGPALLAQPADSTVRVRAKQKQPEASLPKGLIPVPGGKLTLGITAKELVALAEEMHPRSEAKQHKVVHKLLSELGTIEIEVDRFFLHKVPVTNEQYMLFIMATGKRHRFPFHWWKDGKPEHFESKLAEARKKYPGKLPMLTYWERHWQELPFAIPEGTEKQPVTMVSWRDAVACAAWCGMRLPTEAEWVFAATGGQPRPFVWGEAIVDDDRLKLLRLYQSRDQKLRDVGAVEAARGPLGHEDMVGTVWEWVADNGFFPLAGRDAFDREFRKLQRIRGYADMKKPSWDGAKKLLKGGSYFSWAAPEELRIGTRAAVGAAQTMEGAGFRLAKSEEPALDMCQSRLLVEYDASFFGRDREPNLAEQIGVERYALDADGSLITGYHALAFIPINHLGVDKSPSLNRVKEAAREHPMILGTLVTTEKLANPKLEPGMYTVYLRPSGLPKELKDALSTASRELLREQKRNKGKKKGDIEPEDKGKKKKKGGDWRQILARYGIKDEEAIGSQAAKVKFVRLRPGDLEVDATRTQLIFRANSAEGGAGNFIAAVPTNQQLKFKSSADGPPLVAGTRDNLETLTFHFAPSLGPKSRTRRLPITLEIQLTTPPDLTKPWRWPNTN